VGRKAELTAARSASVEGGGGEEGGANSGAQRLL
jgi:hypothetical protein